MWKLALVVMIAWQDDQAPGSGFRDRLRDRFAESPFEKQADKNPFDDSLQKMSFQEASQSQQVGGLVIGKPVSSGKLSLPRFGYEIGTNRVRLHFRTGDGTEWEFETPAEIALRATKTAIDGGTVLFTATGDRFWTHPAMANHRYARQLATVDLYVLRHDLPVGAHSAVVLEDEWKAEPKFLGASEEEPAFHLFVRGQQRGGELQILEDMSRTIEEQVSRGMRGPDSAIVRNYRDFILIHRIVRSIDDGTITDFPEAEWESMIEELLEREASKENLIDETAEQSFSHAFGYHQFHPDGRAMGREFQRTLQLK